MPTWLSSTLYTVGSIVLSLTVTLIFNRLVGLPKELKAQKEATKQREEQLKQENCARDAKIAALQDSVTTCTQNQTQLHATDKEILAACSAIKTSVQDNQNVLNTRLDRLEKRERNTIRATLLDEYRLFTDESKNPMLAWSEMEHHAFFELVRDYEDLHGNDYVHSTVIPAMNELAVIPMSDKPALAELMHSRKI
jgi:hypothetical protein